MDDNARLQKLAKVIADAEKVVAVMESQKKELDETLKSYGFDSVEDLESAISGLGNMVEEESDKLTAKLDDLEMKLVEING